MNIKKSILLRVRVAFLLMALVAVSIIGKIIELQFVQGKRWQEKAHARTRQFREMQATRGNIFADDGSLLATSLPFYKVAFDPTYPDEQTYIKEVDSLCTLLAAYFKEATKEEYKREISLARANKRQYFLLSSQKINYPTRKQMENWPLFRKLKNRQKAAVIFESETSRFKPFGELASRTVGYVLQQQDTNLIGVGLEYSYHKYLKGKNGKALQQRIAKGKWVPLNNSSYIHPEEGYDIYSTVDINIQDAAHTALYRALLENDADFGCVIIMEVKTGHIKAITNLGRENNTKANYSENYNYAIGDRGSTDPGSIFKLASMMALFEETHLSLEELVETGNGVASFYGVKLNDPKSGGFGTLTVREAFEKSSSIGTARLIQKYFKNDPQKFINYLNKFGLNTPLDFQLVGESIPYIKNVNDKTWSPISLPWMSIGYEVRISPLQMLTFYNAVANGGKMVQPLIVKRIQQADEVIDEFNTVVLKEKICSDSTLKKLQSLLEGVVERGTANMVKSKNFKIAGKTGTSQKFKSGKYVKAYHTAFAGYFPANQPKYSCIVVIDNPRGENQFGGDVAAPVFKEIAEKVFLKDLALHKQLQMAQLPEQQYVPVRAKGFTKNLQQIYDALQVAWINREVNSEWSNTSFNDSLRKVQLQGIIIKRNFMPDLRGMTLPDALYILENKGLKVKFNGQGKVIKQTPKPGAVIQKQKVIYLELK